MTAVQAGLTTLPLGLALPPVSLLAGVLTDRLGARYLLLLGSLLYAGGITAVAAVGSLTSTSFAFIIPLMVAGLGLGCLGAPVMTVAMQEVAPMMAGAASGLLNTSRQIGAAMGAAIIGAVLQSRLAGELHDRAVTDAAQLPAPFRQPFIGAFTGAARSGLEVGRGQGGGVRLPASLPPQAVHQAQQLAHDVFVNAFVAAMRPTVGVVVAGMMLGALTSLVIVRHRTVAETPPQASEANAQVGPETARGMTSGRQPPG